MIDEKAATPAADEEFFEPLEDAYAPTQNHSILQYYRLVANPNDVVELAGQV